MHQRLKTDRIERNLAAQTRLAELKLEITQNPNLLEIPNLLRAFQITPATRQTRATLGTRWTAWRLWFGARDTMTKIECGTIRIGADELAGQDELSGGLSGGVYPPPGPRVDGAIRRVVVFPSGVRRTRARIP